jgi:tetratricopeptide (TPR) repeat protein
MRPLAEVLSILASAQSPADAAESVRRVVRLPSLWTALQDPGILERCLRGRSEVLTPAGVLLAASGYSRLSDLMALALAGGPADSNGAASEGTSIRALVLKVVQLIRSKDQPGAIVPTLVAEPEAWSEALACAWPAIEDASGWIQEVTAEVNGQTLRLMANTLLSNDRPEAAAARLSAALGERAALAVATFANSGDTRFAETMAGLVPQAPVTREATASIAASIASRLTHDTPKAIAYAQTAWTEAQAIVADSADALADAAEADGDSLTAVEARRQAVRASSTPTRRSLLALALAGQGEMDSALDVLPAESADPIEQLVRGMVLTLQGNLQEASEVLEAAWSQMETPAALPTALTRALVSASEATGQTTIALELAAARVALDPGDPEARLVHAERLMSTGNAGAAVDEARLARALDPQSTLASEVLAAALRSAGRAAEALEVLGAQAGSEPKTMAAAAEYALEAGQPEVALAWTLRLLDVSPTDTRAKALHAKALARGGDGPQAIREMEALVSSHPEAVQAWLTLSEIQERTGDQPRAGETLVRAVQTVLGSPELHLALGRWYMRQERWSEAELHLREATVGPETHAEALFDLASALDVLGRKDESLVAYERCVRRQPGNWDARVALSRTLESLERYDEASRWLEGLPLEAPPAAHVAAARLLLIQNASSQAGREAAGHLLRARAQGFSTPDLPLWLGRAFEASGDLERAAEAYTEAARVLGNDAPSLGKALLGKGRVSLGAGQAPAAVAAFEQLRQLEPDRAEVQLWLARACLAAGLDQEANAAARKAADLDSGSTEALEVLMMAANQSGAAQEAADAAAKLAHLHPDESSAWLQLAEMQRRLGHAAEAREAVARAVANARKDLAALRDAAGIVTRLDDHAAAEKILESALRWHPESPDLWTDLAELFEAAGEPIRACEAWLRASELRPEDSRAARRAAHALSSAGRQEDGLNVLRKAAETLPSDTGLLVDLAEAHLERGEIAAALPPLRLAAGQPSDDPTTQVRLGHLLVTAGEIDLGLRMLRGASETSPDSAPVWAELAEAYLRSDRPSEALACLERAVRLPDPPLTAYALLVHVHLALGDVSSAWDGLRAASSSRPRSLAEARAVAAAHQRLGEWQSALNTFDEYLEAGGDARVRLDRAALMLRLLDATWLYGDMAGAIRHAPTRTRQHLVESIQDQLRTLPSQIAGGHRLAVLQARLSAWGDISEESPGLLDQACGSGAGPAETLEALAIAYLRAAKPKEALLTLKRLVPSSRFGSWQPLLAGLSHRLLGNTDLAQQAFSAARADPGLAPLAHALTASLDPTARGDNGAIAALNDAIAAWPNEPGWHLQLANLYLVADDVDAALPHLQQAADLDPDNSDAWLALARTLREAGHLGEAQQAYEHVVQLLPRLSQVWKEAGEVALTQADHERATVWFSRSLALQATDAEALIGAARADLGLGRRREARKRAEEAVALHPESAPALQCLGEVLAGEGDVDQALNLLERAIARADKPTSLVAARAKLLTAKGRAAEAVGELQGALQASDDDGLWSSLADAFLALGRHDEAMQAAAEAARISPRRAAHHVQLARISRQAGHLDQAIDQLAQAESLSPASAELAMERGQIHEDRREFDRALEAYQRAVELDPRLAQAYIRAGLVYRGLKAYPQAARMFKRAVELSPDDASALHQLAAVHALALVHGGFQTSAVTT